MMRPEVIKVSAVLLIFVNFMASEAFGSSSKLLSQKQKDEVMALHLLNSNPEGAYRAAAIAQAVRYAKNRYAGVYNPAEISRAEALSYMNPLSTSAYKAIFAPRDNHGKSLDQTLAETANRVYYETGIQVIDGKLTRKAVDYLGNVAVAVSPLIVGPAGAAAVAVGKHTIDLFFDPSETIGGHQGLGLPQRVVIEELVYAQNEIRNGTEAGKAIHGHFFNLTGDDPLKNSDDKKPVQEALALKASIQNHASEEKLVERVENIEKLLQATLTETRGGLKEIKKNIEGINKAQAQGTRRREFDGNRLRRQEIAFKLQNYRGGLLISGYMLELAGDKKGAQIAFGVADMADKVSTLISSAEKMAPMMLAAGYVGVAMTAVSLLKSTSGPDPYAAIFKMLQQISKQLNELREEMVTSFAQLRTQMGNLLMANLDLTDAVKRDTEFLRQRLNEIQKQLEDAQERLTEQNAVIAGIQMDSEDRECIRISNRRLLEPTRDFIWCRDLYVNRAVNLARQPLFNLSLSEKTASFDEEMVGAFPFATRYQTVQNALGMGGLQASNPAVWYDSVGKILLLLQAHPKYLRTIDFVSDWQNPRSLELDSMIRIGEQIRDFMLSIAFNKDNGKHRFNGNNLEVLLKNLEEAYDKADLSVAEDLKRTGLNPSVDVTQLSDKQRNLDYTHQFLADGGVQYCDKSLVGEKPGVTFVNPKSVSYARNGGRHGRIIIRRPGDLPFIGVGPHAILLYRKANLTEDLNADFAGTKAATFHPDSSILPVLAPQVRLLEILWPNSPISVCLAGVKIHNLEMNQKTGVKAGVELNYLVLAPINGKMEVVQKLSGTRQVEVPFFAYGYNQHRRTALFLEKVLSQIRGRYHEFLNSSTVDDKFNKIKFIVDRHLDEKRRNFRNNVEDAGHSARIEEARALLIMAASIGLNTSHAVVDEFVRRARELPTMNERLDEIVIRGKSLVGENKRIRKSIEELRNLLSEMQKLPVAEILPNTTPLEAKINQLKVAKDQRALQALGNVY